MAGPVRCRLSLKCFIMMLVSWAKFAKRKGKHLWAFSVANYYAISVILSVLLILLNLILYKFNYQIMRLLLEPVPLAHGYAPVFPSHYFHKPSIRYLNVSLQSVNDPDRVDMFLNSLVLQDSLTSSVPPVVHVISCDIGPFTFTHFLSVLAAFKFFSPSILNLHVIQEPDLDPDGYFQFLQDLKRDLPPLVMKKLQQPKACHGSAEEKSIAYLRLLGAVGGVVINSRTIIAPSAPMVSLINSPISVVSNEDVTDVLVIALQSNVLSDTFDSKTLTTHLHSKSTKHMTCDSARAFSFSTQSICAYVHEDIYPVMIFNGTTHFDYFARWVGYGSSRQLVSRPAERDIVPNIVHYVWFGKNTLNYFAYLSLLSSLYVLNAETVYVHGNYKPIGKYWEEAEKHPRVKFINRDFPDSVYGEPIVAFASHASDYLRADVLNRYGGVYADWDVIFLKEMPESVKRHNTTSNVDWPETGAFPDVFNLGVLVSAPGAPYLRHFLESYRWYLDKYWSYNAIHMPYKVYEKQPQSLNIDRHLQVLCALDKCHATWLPRYKKDNEDHLGTHAFDWRSDAMAIHWTHPDPVAFESREALLASKSVEGDIGKFVLKKAGLLQ